MRLQRSLPKLKKGKPLFVRQVVGKSMLPTLQPGGYVLVSGLLKPNEGDVVVVNHDNKEKIKRINRIEDAHVNVTGDNPEASTDSRNFGSIPVELVVGVVLWPRLKSSLHPDQVG